MKKIILICLILLGCTSKSLKTMRANRYCNALGFLTSKNYIFSTSKSDLPVIVIDSLSRINSEAFEIGDSKTANKINLSNAWLDGHEYKRKLHFALVSDTFCLISYTEGGIVSHDVVDYLKYKENLIIPDM
ncbi:MAG: hypothetical protein ACTHMD_03300 [Flavisolibacter sp.]